MTTMYIIIMYMQLFPCIKTSFLMTLDHVSSRYVQSCHVEILSRREISLYWTVRAGAEAPGGQAAAIDVYGGGVLPRRSCTKKERLSLIGHLQHASRIVRPGRPFLRRMIDLSAAAHKLHHHIRLRGEFKSDLLWWAMFMGRCMEWHEHVVLFGACNPRDRSDFGCVGDLGVWGFPVVGGVVPV